MAVLRLTLLALAVLVATTTTGPSTAYAKPPSRPPPVDDFARAAAVLEARPHPHYLLPAIENLVAVTAGAGWYWIDRNRQVGDWDFPSLKQRLTFEAWRFDNNGFPINFAWHAYDGAQYHLFARSSDLSLPVSVAYGLGTSLAWEFGVEFREKVSINDVLVTTGAGTALGEFVHWLGRYLESAPEPRGWHRPARWLLTTTRAAHNAGFGLTSARLRPNTTADQLGLSSDIWHRFDFTAGMMTGRLAGTAAAASGPDRLTLGEISARAELAAMPGYLTAPSLSRSFVSGNLTRAAMRIRGGDDSLGVDFSVDTLLLGYHQQKLPRDGVGVATTLGVSLAYRYRRELLGDYTDRLAQMHLPGLALDHRLRVGTTNLHAGLRAHLDFAGVHATAYRDWQTAHPDAVDKAILRKHGYYYGWGPSMTAELEASRGGVSAGASLELARYTSQQGLDRTQELVTLDVRSADRFRRWDAWLRIGPPSGSLFLEARVADTHRRGNVGEFSADDALRTVSLSLGTTR